MASRRILFVSHHCYLDNTSSAAVIGRTMMELLARQGFVVQALSGTVLDLDCEVEPTAWLLECGWISQKSEVQLSDAGRDASPFPPHLRLTVRSVPVILHRSPTTKLHEPDEAERGDFLRLYEDTLAGFRPDVVVGYGGGLVARECFSRAHSRGAATVFMLHNFHYHDPSTFTDVNAVIVHSHLAAEYYRNALDLNCTVLPIPIDYDHSHVEQFEQKYVTFINPSIENGVYIFAKIADELGHKRPDIPLLVVEGRATEATLAACGIDLRSHGNINLMASSHAKRRIWGVTRVCLLPALGPESQPLSVVEATINGIPVICSDRPGISETLGKAGVVLPLPERLTPATRTLPSTDEIRPWIETIIRLWDDEGYFAECHHQALEEAERWSPVTVASQYAQLFTAINPGPRLVGKLPHGRSKAVVLVPHLSNIEGECEEGLRHLEHLGVRVVRLGGSSAIDVARNVLASDALHDGFESLLFIDSDIGFDPMDALRLLARPESVVAGIYVKKNERALSSVFAEGITEALFGFGGTGLYPLKFAATGFLRIRAQVLQRMIDDLSLPLCNTKWSRGLWPFFQPSIIPLEDGSFHYLGEDWAFSHRLGQIGVTPLADTSIRLWHFGRFGYSWEDAGTSVHRYPSYFYRAKQK